MVVANSNLKTIAIVDGYSSAAQYAALAQLQGFTVIHIQSSVVIPQAYIKSFQAKSYFKNLVYQSHLLEELLNELMQLKVVAVFAGIETGVELADLISEKLQLKTNGTIKSQSRRDKYLMHNQIKKNGIRIPEQIFSSQTSEIIEWVKNREFKKVVIKPANSAGSDDVVILNSIDNLPEIMSRIVGKKNQLGLQNVGVLAQEYIGGYECAVNAVSFNGKPQFTHIWRYHKLNSPSGHFVYDYEELLPGDGQTEYEIYRYVTDVIQSLGIEHGPTHTEIKVDSLGPVIIESGARIDGISQINFDRLILGEGQIELSLKAWTEHFNEISVLDFKPYKAKLSAYNVELISNSSGTISAIPGLAIIQKLKSYIEHRLRFQVGDSICPTIDLFTSPGIIFLAHESLDQVREDYNTIRRLERDGQLFTTT
jgi:biotin carboxylase